jgi:hypothetical protein
VEVKWCPTNRIQLTVNRRFSLDRGWRHSLDTHELQIFSAEIIDGTSKYMSYTKQFLNAFSLSML